MCGDGVDVIELPIDDSWFRDCGPIYVTDGERRVALDWAFNAWGGKFEPYADDAALARRYAESMGDEVRTIPVVLEGGAIAVDGAGTLVTTEQCLLHPNRNPALTRADIEAVLRAELGVTTISGCPTASPSTTTPTATSTTSPPSPVPARLLMQGCDDESEHDWLLANVNVRCARGAIDALGEPIEVVEIPVLPFTEIGGERVAVPYLNFYVANGVVVVPVCGHPADADMVATSSPSSTPTARWSASTSVPCSPTAAAASTASPNKSPASADLCGCVVWSVSACTTAEVVLADTELVRRVSTRRRRRRRRLRWRCRPPRRSPRRRAPRPRCAGR